MRKVSLFFLFFTLLQLALIAQEATLTQSNELHIKRMKNVDVNVQNTFSINTPNLEFSPTYYQNGLVYVTAYGQSKELDDNIGVPFFELSYAELDGAGMPTNPKPFSAKVNSSTHEGPVAFNFTEDIIYYTSNSAQSSVAGKHHLKIFAARKGISDWENSIEVPFNSNQYTTMHPSLSTNGNILYFASDMPGGYGGMDIYAVEREGNTWGVPMNLGPNINTNQNEAFPFIHQSGRLFFSSEGHEGMGGYDIFAVNTLDKPIKEIIHFGAAFNSPNADLGLILNPTGKQGYFASSRSDGEGQDDIYLFDAPNGLFEDAAAPVSRVNILIVDSKDESPIADAGVSIFEENENGSFGVANLYESASDTKENRLKEKELGEPDFYTNNEGGIVTDLVPNKAYLILVTKKGYPSKKLRYFATEQPTYLPVYIPLTAKECIAVKGVLLNEKTGAVIPNATIVIQSKCEDTVESIKADAAGKYKQCLPIDCEYTLSVEKTGYYTGRGTFSTENVTQSAMQVNIRMNPTKQNRVIVPDNLMEGSTIVLENIYYDYNKSTIRLGAAEDLDVLVTLMRQHPSMEVEVTAHTDARGDARYNRKLSLARAVSAKKYLQRKGIADNRIKAFGKGEEAIRNHCRNGVDCEEEEHEYNRRTEVKIIKLPTPIGVQYSRN